MKKDNIFEAELKILLIGFDGELVTLRLNGKKIYQKSPKIFDPSVGVSDGLSLRVDEAFLLSVSSESTNIEENVEVVEDTTIFIVNSADRYVIRPSSDPLLLD